MKLQKHSPVSFTPESTGGQISPVRALRTQAGVRSTFGRLLLQETLHKCRNYTSPVRATDCSVTPSGFMRDAHGSRGFTPAQKPLLHKPCKGDRTFCHPVGVPMGYAL